MTKPTIKICLIDDHGILRSALQTYLESTKEFVVIASCENGNEGLKQIQNKIPDLVILDIEMPELDGIKTLRNIKEKYPDLPVLILSFCNDTSIQVKTIKEGASGVISKSSDLTELNLAIKTILSEGLYLPTEIGKLLIRKNEIFEVELNQKEIRMIEMLVNEEKIEKIADELNISKRSAENLRTKVMGKVGVSTSYGLARHAIKTGLLYFTN